MFRREPTQEEAEFLEIVDAWLDAKAKGKAEGPRKKATANKKVELK